MSLPSEAEELALGYVTAWVGTTQVTASCAGVREVWLPDWHNKPAGTTGYEAAPAQEVRIEQPGAAEAERHLRTALEELAEYFAGARRAFTVALDLRGTAFYRRVWAEVMRVPYGETSTYAEVARAIGEPRAVRAVGAANGANPVAPFVPCHRVVASDGQLRDYGPGLPLKERLLLMEDALPAGADDYTGWLGRAAARLGSDEVVHGIRGVGIYCRPGCSRPLRQRLRPGRMFRTPAEAEEAGFRPCDRCQPQGVAARRARWKQQSFA
jgi:methylated-DNA-[protein]-cysteine S-methyltransferase